MLARLQQLTTLGALAAALLWAVLLWRAGHPWAAGLGAALLAGGYAAVLALEFVLLHLAHGNDPTPRPTPLQLLRAWWGEVCAAPRVFGWRQPFCSSRWPDRLTGDASSAAKKLTEQVKGKRGVLLIHGFVCNRGLWNPWLQRLHQQGTPFVALSLEPVFGGIDDYAPQIEQAVQRLLAATGLAPVVVAHSMGGLALRRWWVDHLGATQTATQTSTQTAAQATPSRIHHAITIGTPHHGTWLARFATTRNAQQMQQNSRWLLALQAREPADHAQHFTCFYGHCDNIVFPPATATLVGANNQHLPAVAHVCMADAPEPWAELQRRLGHD
jgi:triacylglycerol lipase